MAINVSTSADFDRVVLEFMADDPLTVTYRSNTQSYSDATATNTITTHEIDCQAIFLDHQLRTSGDTTKDQTLIRQSDKLMFLRPPEKTDPDALPLVINPALDRILVGAVSYKIVSFKQTNPSATNCILYELYLRN